MFGSLQEMRAAGIVSGRRHHPGGGHLVSEGRVPASSQRPVRHSASQGECIQFAPNKAAQFREILLWLSQSYARCITIEKLDSRLLKSIEHGINISGVPTDAIGR
jgi:hypothetical protein